MLKKQVHEKEIEILQNQERLKAEFEKRMKSIQSEIDRSDDYKNKVHDLGLQIRSEF